MLSYTAKAKLPTAYGTFSVYAFCEQDNGKEHLVLTLGDVAVPSLLVRVHSSCITGDALGSLRCDCGSQLDLAIKNIAKEKNGMLIYLAQEGRGIGLGNKIRAYELQDKGEDTVSANLKLGFEADQRNYMVCAPILKYFNVPSIRLMTNNPDKVKKLRALGVNVVDVIPHQGTPTSHNEEYLRIKARKMGHKL